MLSRRALALAAVLVAGCSRGGAGAAQVDAKPVDAGVSTASASPRPSSHPSPSASSATSTADAATGPIVVKGYPHEIRNGMNDPAGHVGWTRDGALFGYCAEFGGEGPTLHCEFIDASGAATKMVSTTNDNPDAKKRREILDFLRDRGVPAVPGFDSQHAMPSRLAGTWSFTDITIDVARIAATGLDGKGKTPSPAVLKVGGSVSGEPPVHPLVLSSYVVPGAPPHFVVMNGMELSPDGRELGMVGHFFACEYCDSFVVKRITLGAFASLVYNDTGFRHHKKGDFARAAELFQKAIAADPTAKLPPYNLACAWALTSDARTKDALRSAIDKDATAKTRARNDKDFEKVRAEPWFVELTR